MTYAGVDWRMVPESAGQLFSVFLVVRQLHEMLLHLDQAFELPEAAALHKDLQILRHEIAALVDSSPEELLALDVPSLRSRAGALFLTQPQIEVARGDATTRLPDGFTTPRHWVA